MKTSVHPPQSAVKVQNSEFSVFVVDDDESFLFPFSYHLKKDTGWKVFCYGSAEECLCHLHLNPRVIVLDYFFNRAGENNIDGMTALRLIKSLRPEIPVVMISAQDEISVSMELLRAGAFTYIVKDRQAFHTIEQSLQSLRSVIHNRTLPKPKKSSAKKSD